MLADNRDPASMVTLPATSGKVRAAALTLKLHTGQNSVTISNVSNPGCAFGRLLSCRGWRSRRGSWPLIRLVS
jgi:hypothetical protein